MAPIVTAQALPITIVEKRPEYATPRATSAPEMPARKNSTSESGRLRTTGTPARAAMAMIAAASIGVAYQTKRGGSLIDNTM